ncbi:site-specific integrase [Pseudomonas plecoglossicida]|uniref:site-specific integrase n=1 Tax=Pseudomonas plecoglossicida TaxID=70775 RepID=UPI003977CFC9
MAQLYRLLSNIKLPTGASPTMRSKQHIVTYSKLNSLPLMLWPNATPCHLANLWLMEVALSSSGKESAKTDAALLTHLIRFCFTREISFYDFNDAYFRTFTRELVNELKPGTTQATRQARLSNQTYSIQQICLNFLLWLQQKHPPHNQLPVIGAAIDQPRVTIEWRYSAQSNRKYLWHPDLVTKAPPSNDKFPMPDKYIAKLRNAVYQRYHKLIERALKPDGSCNPSTTATLKYLYSRRMFTINMMTNFGLRPEELEEMPLDDNLNIMGTLTVVLPTKKTRYQNISRKLTVTMGLAVTLQAYFDDRAEFIKYLASNGKPTSQIKNILLGKNGAPLIKASLTKEFDRLCLDAGLKNRKVCLSMFRHRFISREVKAELLLRFRKNPELLAELTPALRENVARAVMPKTGHRRPNSIWHYVDEQYKLLATPDSHEAFQSIKDDLEHTKNALEDLTFRQHFNTKDKTTSDLEAMRQTIRDIEERLYAAEKPSGKDDTP